MIHSCLQSYAWETAWLLFQVHSMLEKLRSNVGFSGFTAKTYVQRTDNCIATISISPRMESPDT
eukprot:4704599-Ditylum_brightwellii.AAC.1